jgi:hypothetical protein
MTPDHNDFGAVVGQTGRSCAEDSLRAGPAQAHWLRAGFGHILAAGWA